MSVVIDHVTKVFESPDDPSRRVVAVNNVSLDIKEGEMVTFLGPSGCGKTTTLRMVAGFELPTEGRISIGGQDVTFLPPNKRDTAMVFQSYAIFPHLSVKENVAFGLRLKRLSEQEIETRVKRMLEMVGLGGMASRSPEQLSGGQQQRVALARAIVNEPSVLLFDEPLSNLDAKLREQMRHEIRALQQRLGITSIYVTHDQSEAMTLSDRIVVMRDGRIEQVGTPIEIYTRPANRFVASFIGTANLIPARVTARDGEGVEVRLVERSLRLPQPELDV
ncbi:MAG: ABC transporter ATP-binding protein, partial [Firmicutes bacterium]|nr:ABC transporter ATP-binding protein [Bacillota bacterium]